MQIFSVQCIRLLKCWMPLMIAKHSSVGYVNMSLVIIDCQLSLALLASLVDCTEWWKLCFPWICPFVCAQWRLNSSRSKIVSADITSRNFSKGVWSVSYDPSHFECYLLVTWKRSKLRTANWHSFKYYFVKIHLVKICIFYAWYAFITNFGDIVVTYRVRNNSHLVIPHVISGNTVQTLQKLDSGFDVIQA